MSRQLKPLRILVTDTDKLAGLGAVRSLGRAGHHVVAACPQGVDRHLSARSRYCSTSLRSPDSRKSQFEFKDWLREHARRGTFDAILPITEASVVGVASVRKELPRELLLFLPSDAALEYTLSKFHSTRMALSLGIPCPPTVFVADGSKADKWNEDFSALAYPILIKTDNYQTEQGAYHSGLRFVAGNAEEAHRVLRNLEHLRTRIIAQQIIPGSGSGAFLLRFAGQTHLSFAHRRLHEVPYTGGASSFRESCHDTQLIGFGEQILAAIDYDGVAMVEFRRSASEGTPYFLEINGRLWGSLSLALHAGVDFPTALVECYQHGVSTRGSRPYRSGIRCRNVFPGELSYVVSVLRAKPVNGIEPPPSKLRTIREFVTLSLNPWIRHDWFWWSDPLPGLLQAASTVTWLGRRMFSKALGAVRARSTDRILANVRSEHAARCAAPSYFRRPLKRILFLCYGNIIRSPFAATYWNAEMRKRASAQPVALSAGFHHHTGRRVPTWILQLAAEHQIDLSQHYSSVITPRQVEAADAILVMDRKNYLDLHAQYPWAMSKTYFLGLFSRGSQLEIADPYNSSEEDARGCLRHLARSLDGLMAHVLAH